MVFNIHNIETVSIAQNQALSPAVCIDGYKFFTIAMPAAWDAAALTFQGSFDNVTFFDLYMDGSEVSEVVVAAKAYVINLNALAFMSVKYIKVRSGTSATPVNQTAARTIKLGCSY